MAQTYWPTDHWPTDYWPTEYWLGGTAPDVTGTISASLDDITAGTDSAYSKFWAVNYWPQEYWPDGYWGSPHSGWLGVFIPTPTSGSRIVASLGNITASFVGSAIHKDFFDVTLDLSQNWVDNEYFAYAGTIAGTLDDTTAAFVGTAGSVDGVIGYISSPLEDVTSSLSGTFTAPANQIGTIAGTLDDVTGALTGLALEPFSVIASLNATLDDVASSISGTFEVPVYTGMIDTDLDAVTVEIVGASYSAGVSLFHISGTLDDIESQIVGTSEFEAHIITSTPGLPNTKAVRRVGSNRNKTRVGTLRKVRVR